MSGQFGLDESVIRQLGDVFKQYEAIEIVIVYGSRAKGTYSIGSDIDLTIKGPTLTTSDLFQIENHIDDLLLPFKVDLSLFHQIENQNLIDHIERVGQPFYRKQ